MSSARERARKAVRPLALQNTMEPFKQADAMADAAYDEIVPLVKKTIVELEAEHQPDPEIGGRRGGCVMCWPKDGSWPCVTRMIADELKEAFSD